MTYRILFAAALAAAIPAQAQTDLLDRAVSRYEKTTTARAEFKQTLTNPLTGSTSISRGVLLRRAPNLLSVKFDGADGDRVVADGTSLWIYSPMSAPGQVIKLPNSGGAMNNVDPGSQFLVAPRKKYNIKALGSATVGGRATQIFQLTPRQQTAFTKAIVWIDASDASVKKFETTDANGLKRVVEILAWKPNVAIPKSAFRFSPPAGTRVVDQSALTGAR
ncbi:MAG: outer membrane lipoprotein carrier protein LolA [Gemmatimonadaceae bacterium]|nr:outer membrane lipoprotein carrier protein LolA [Gemmatimonadaceae bacterium]